MNLVTKELLKKFDSVKPYEGDASMDAKVLVHYFGGPMDWVVTSAEKEGDDYILYGYGSMGYGYEYGSVMLSEIKSLRIPPFGLGAERDLYMGKDPRVKDFVEGKLM